MALTEYDRDEVAQLDFTVRNISNTLVDPVTLTAEARRPDGTVSDISGYITHGSTGVYQILLPLPDSGDWNIKIVTTNPDDTKRFSLYVRPETVDAPLLEPYALTTLHAARLWVLRDAGADSQDELLASLINGCSLAIINYTQREFTATDDETRTLAYNGDGALSLAPWELRDATEVTYLADGATTLQTLDTTLFRPEPVQRTREGTYLSLRLGSSPWGWSGGLGAEISITGDWGMETIPSDVEMACKVAVADGYRNPGSVTSYSTAGGFVAGEPLTGPAGSLPLGARRLLMPYMRTRRVGSVRLHRQQPGWDGGIYVANR